VKCVLSQHDWKVTKCISDTSSTCWKTNYVKIREKLQRHIKCWRGTLPWALHSQLLSCLMQPNEEFLCLGKRHWQFVWHRKIGKCIFKHFLAVYVRTSCQRVFESEKFLHTWKRHPYTSTVWRKVTDWRAQVTTWGDLRGLLYSHRDIVCLLNGSNCIICNHQ
jgi:hypothetical protein